MITALIGVNCDIVHRMTDAFSVIVIILSVTLFVFLILAIILIVYIIRLVKMLRLLADKGENLVNKAEEISEGIRESAQAVSLLRIVSTAVRLISKAKRR